MSWVKFPNQVNNLLTLRRALKEAAALTPPEIGDDGTYGYRLLEAGVIASSKSAEEWRALRLGLQSPRASARGLRELFRLCGFMRVEGNGVALTVDGLRVSEFDDEAIGDEERNIWQRALANLKFPHGEYPDLSAAGVEFRPLHVTLRILEPGPLPSQGLAFAFSVENETPEEITKARNLALKWTPNDSATLAAEIGKTKQELENNAKVFPGLLEQLGLIQRQGGIAMIQEPGIRLIGSDPSAASPPTAVYSPLPAARPVNSDQGRAWTPTAADPGDTAESARLRLVRLEKANQDHQAAVRVLDEFLRARGFETSELDYDILAKRESAWVLIEVKSLGMRSPRRQVISAVGQLAYYRALSVGDLPGVVTLHRMVFFDRSMTDERAKTVLETEGILSGWMDEAEVCSFSDGAAAVEGLLD